MEGYGNENPGAFQSTRPLRGATLTGMTFREMFGISTHAPLAGRDRYSVSTASEPSLFQPTRPLRGATSWDARRPARSCYFNPRAPCGARPDAARLLAVPWYFNPRAPCGARLRRSVGLQWCIQFQPTRPLRGATTTTSQAATWILFQPTRPLRGATLFIFGQLNNKLFQPTRPLRGATSAQRDAKRDLRISTHAPLAGRDQVTVVTKTRTTNFNPRAPCGARQ